MKGREEERTYELVASDYFMHSSIERQRRLLDERRGEWIARRMEMIAKETKERLLGTGVEFRVDKQAVEKKPATISLEDVLGKEQYFMELLLVCEVREWEKLFWIKFKAFLVKIGKYRLEEKERLAREWRANCWRRLNPQMDAALKRLANVDDMEDKDLFLESLGRQWALSISLLFDGADNRNIISLSEFRGEIGDTLVDGEMHLRMEKELEDTEFRLKRGSDLRRFDQFWDDHTLFKCRYSRSKWLLFSQSSTVPLKVYLNALKGNKNIIHISFDYMKTIMKSDFDVNRFLYDLPWVTSISPGPYTTIPAIRRDLLFVKSIINNLNTFAKEIKLDPSSTYIFSDAGIFDVCSDEIGNNARILISFVAPTSGKRLLLRVKHSGEEDAPLEVTLRSTKLQLNPPSKSSLTIDDITLYPTEVSDPSESDHLSFVPEVRNNIFIQFVGPVFHGHYLNDIV